MDRNTFIGFALIGLVLMAWIWMNTPPPPKPGSAQDTTAVHRVVADTNRPVPKEPVQKSSPDSLGKYFTSHTGGEEKFFTIETDLYRANISSRGGVIRSWVLKDFQTWNKYPLDLINDTSGDFSMMFYTSDGKLINTKSLNFESSFANNSTLELHGNDSVKLELVINLDKKKLVKTMTFFNGSYSFNCEYRFEGMEDVISNYEYEVVWEDGLRYAERNSVDESNSATSFCYAGGELTEADASKMNDSVKQTISGKISWVATRTKYFGLVIIPQNDDNQGGYLSGKHVPRPDNGGQEIYSLGVKMPYLGKPVETGKFVVFLGPLDYTLLKNYHDNLEQIMPLGFAWIIRPIAQYVLMPLFQALHYVIPNWGWVIIVFTIIIKVALYPFSKSSMKSMKKMQALQPMMDEIKEKYKDDPQKMNQSVMRLYKEYGINPAGGCLPLLLQMPILYALWAVFRSTIQLRHAHFIGWITDLAVPDVIARLPFAIPIFNITELSGLALAMGVTMFIQQKMTVKDPRQKAMVWMMPIMMTLLFNSLPSGLNLYYFFFNLLQIGQQTYMNKFQEDEPLRKVEPKKQKSGGIIGRLAKEMPKMNKK
ncbi:MAG: membrane protein insertase YidC [Bacteroidota bacterium]